MFKQLLQKRKALFQWCAVAFIVELLPLALNSLHLQILYFNECRENCIEAFTIFVRSAYRTTYCQNIAVDHALVYLQNKNKKGLTWNAGRIACTVDFVVIGMHLNWPYAARLCMPKRKRLQSHSGPLFRTISLAISLFK